MEGAPEIAHNSADSIALRTLESEQKSVFRFPVRVQCKNNDLSRRALQLRASSWLILIFIGVRASGGGVVRCGAFCAVCIFVLVLF